MTTHQDAAVHHVDRANYKFRAASPLEVLDTRHAPDRLNYRMLDRVLHQGGRSPDPEEDTMVAPTMVIWTIFDHPNDFPDHFVAREFLVRGSEVVPTPSTIQSTDLEVLRDTMTRDFHLACVPRAAGDHPAIVETWL